MWDLIVSVPDPCLSFYFGTYTCIALDDERILASVKGVASFNEEEKCASYDRIQTFFCKTIKRM